MDKLTEKELQEIAAAVEKEFPEDLALQEVHIARRLNRREREMKGLSVLDYYREKEKGFSGTIIHLAEGRTKK